MDKDLILKKEDIHQLNILLTKIVDTARAECIMLINKSGRLIASQSEISGYDKTSLAALISGNFASSSSIANLIGEDNFFSMVQEGEKKHIYVAHVDFNTLIACIFDKRTTTEKVKKSINQFQDSFLGLLKRFYSEFNANPYTNLNLSADQ